MSAWDRVLAMREAATDGFVGSEKGKLGSYIPIMYQGGRKGLAFSFRRASLTGLPFGVGKGGPETLSPDMLGLRTRLVPDQCGRGSALLLEAVESQVDVVVWFAGVSRKLAEAATPISSSEDEPRPAANVSMQPKKVSTCSPTTPKARNDEQDFSAIAFTRASKARWRHLLPRKNYCRSSKVKLKAKISSTLPQAS